MKSTEHLKQVIRDEIEHGTDRTVVDVLLHEGVDLRNAPPLDEMKSLVVEAIRTTDGSRCVAC